jgi:hypothetical protein
MVRMMGVCMERLWVPNDEDDVGVYGALVGV